MTTAEEDRARMIAGRGRIRTQLVATPVASPTTRVRLKPHRQADTLDCGRL